MARPPRTAVEALAAAVRESLDPTHDYGGMCLRAVRQLLAVGAREPNAAAAWRACPTGARHAGVAPPGVPIFWEVGRFGHVALSAGHGLCWSTDIMRHGKLDIIPVGLVHLRWGAHLLGWTTILNGVRVPQPPP